MIPLALRLLRRLGPWAGERPARGVERRELRLGSMRAWLFAPERAEPEGIYLVAPGLHPLGPADPRFERFCANLASAGLLVLAPFLDAHLALRIDAGAAGQLALAFDEAERLARARGLPRPPLFSISFGSLPAIALASRGDYRDRVGALVLFGGYADFAATVRYALAGEGHDPTNAPVVLLNLLPFLLTNVSEHAPLEAALREMVDRTWGRPELKLPGARDPIARDIAAPLSGEARSLFLQACLLEPGAPALLEQGLARAGRALDFADPRPALGRVRAPVLIVHGRGDDVIPWTEADKLLAALPQGHRARALVTGLYHHSGASLPGPLALLAEGRKLLEVVRALADAPRGLL
jgi:pimeloyl-ACP methyl ester carboxylesterase